MFRLANTSAGAAATARNREVQLSIRAGVLRRILTLWPVWDPERPDTFGQFLEAVTPIIRQAHGASSQAAAAYYPAYRLVERIPGPVPDVQFAELVEDAVRTSMYVTGETQVNRSLNAGMTVAAAKRQAFTTLSGAVARHVAAGARDTLHQTILSDPVAYGWERMTGRDPCAFCAMLASRGAIYSETSVAVDLTGVDPQFRPVLQSGGRRQRRRSGDLYHDHCQCYLEPRFDGDPFLSAENRRWRDLWNRAQRDGDVTGTKNDALNNFRQLVGAG
jgi:hypothetical protein